ncbi:perilipin-2-like isoform X1 [Seriola aureovittata]|uniref:perilipin-2-like isoform X1 n=1 Tax=Seriola aureovittata TaxID=2871759 RepID=UPI0024BEC571|nr:perilipin-2-like isoform X1 [Seriola aureovittata]
MPMNNNQKAPSAAARLVKLPLVRSACRKLLVVYNDTKCSHPNLRTMCEVLENGVTALGTAACERASPVIVKLEPQISSANDVACKSLDWLETTFPVLHTPTEQVVATAKNKMHEIQDVVSIAVNGTMDCVQHTVTWVMERMQQVDEGTNQTLVERAIIVAAVGLDSALSMSEAVMDRVLPPTEQDKKEEAAAHLVKGFEADAPRRSYTVRLVSLSAKLCRRTYYKAGAKMHSVQIVETLSRSSALVPDLQTTWLTMTRNLRDLPQYLQHQAVSVLFFISQMYNLSCLPSEQNQSSQVIDHLNASEVFSPHKDVVQVQPHAKPTCQLRRPIKTSAFDNGCNVKGCVRR